MSSTCCRTVLHVSIWAVLILTSDASDADGEDSTCETEIKVRRHTVVEAVVGQELAINCPLTFCNSSPPTVSWLKLGENGVPVPVDVSRDNHIKTRWRKINKNEGISSLVFKHIVSSDSRQYQCGSGGNMGHVINVSVHGKAELITATWTTGKPGKAELTTATWTTGKLADAEFTEFTEDSSQLNLFCVVGIMVLVIAAVAVYVTPKPVCKGDNCVYNSRSKTEPHPENRVSGSSSSH